jgi:hypothetical protein
VFGQLDAVAADPTGGADDGDPVAGLDFTYVTQKPQGRPCAVGYVGHLLKTGAFRHFCKRAVSVDAQILRMGAMTAGAEDAIALLELGDALPHLHDLAGEVRAGDAVAGTGEACHQTTEDRQKSREVRCPHSTVALGYGAGMDPDEYLPFADFGSVDICDGKHVWGAIRVIHDCRHRLFA